MESDKNEVAQDNHHVQYQDGNPTLQDYMAELDVKVHSPLCLINEMLMNLDELGDDNEETQRHLRNTMWAVLEHWKEINERFNKYCQADNK